MSRSKIDQIYRRLLMTKFFVKGWGKPESLHRIFSFRKILSNREQCYRLVDPMTPVNITKVKDEGAYMLYEGYFMSPFNLHMPELMPENCKRATFQMILPHKWRQQDYRPICIHLAGTGDHGFWRRRTLLAKPLLQDHGIASIMLENPFYGSRKPPEQVRSSLRNVSDLFVMGGCLIMECMVLLHWCLRQRLGPVALSGVSMGGHMASLAACSWPFPVPLIPCLSWTTASGVFTQGVLSGSLNWEMLKNQYLSNKTFRDELFNIIHSPEGYFNIYHEVGQHFAREFPNSMDRVEGIVMDDLSKTESAPKHDIAKTNLNATINSMTSNNSVVTDKGRPGPSLNTDENISLRPSGSKDVTDSAINASVNLNSCGGHNIDVLNNCNDLANNKINNVDTTDGIDLPPPQFSHIDSQSNALNALDVPTQGNTSCTNNPKLQLDATSENIDPAATTFNVAIKPPGISFASYGLQSMKEVPVLLSSAVVSTGKFGERVGRSIITTFNHFNFIGSFKHKTTAAPEASSNDAGGGSSTQTVLQSSPTSKKKYSDIFSLFKRHRDVRLTTGWNSWRRSGTAAGTTIPDPHFGFTPVGVRPSNSKQSKFVSFKPYYTVKDPVTWEAFQFMRGIMDECTHVGNFEMPVDTELIIIIQAIRDAYEPADSMQPLNEVWPGSELRTIDTGHITAFILHNGVFRKAIKDAMQRCYARHKTTQNWTQGGLPPILPTEL